MQISRGDIFYINKYSTVGSEQYAGRPAVIVSNDENNEHSSTVEIIYLTSQPKTDLPTHVTIRSCSRESIALCEQITTVAKERIGDYKGHVTDTEMINLEIAMLVSLSMSYQESPTVNTCDNLKPDVMTKDEYTDNLLSQLQASEVKCKMLQQMYDALLNKVIRAE